MKRSVNPVGRPAKDRIVKYADMGERIQRLTRSRGMVRADLERLMSQVHCNAGTLGNYWNGLRPVHTKHAGELAHILGVTVGYLLYGTKEEAPTIIETPASTSLSQEEKYILKRILEKITT